MAHAEQANPSPLCNTRCRTYPDISGHIRTARHRRAKKGRRVQSCLSPDRVRYRRSRAHGAGAGSRAVPSVAGARSRCRIVCRTVGRGRKEPVPNTAWGMVVVCGIARRRIACGTTRRPITCHHVPARVGDIGVPAVPPVGHPTGPSPAMPRPNMACSRRRVY